MERDSGSQSERMAEAARTLHHHHKDLAATYRLAVEVAHANVEGCDSAGLSIVRHRTSVETVAATTDLATTAARLQNEVGEGPCLDALWEDKTVYGPDLRYSDRWPTWGPRVVAETDARSVLAFQLFTHANTLGALNLYSTRLDAFDDTAWEEGRAIAAHTAIAVATAREIDSLGQGLDSRTVIGQATGILMGRFNLDADVAFKVLARYSSTSNTKLRDVATEIVRTGVLPRVHTDALAEQRAAHGIDSDGNRADREQ